MLRGATRLVVKLSEIMPIIVKIQTHDLAYQNENISFINIRIYSNIRIIWSIQIYSNTFLQSE